ncbi:MAG: sigma-E processing peptidase SpoIIGA [Lachnospiraceae bacterium]|nr:sigma-E processing peptidase SpoIIGA [Lachnospiraceae bacterium]
MQITVYFDLIFIINFLVDFYVLFITGKIIRQKVDIVKIGLGALFGALAFLPLIFFPKLLMGTSGIFITVGISMGTVAIALGKTGGFIKKWFLSTTIMFLLGGTIQCIKLSFGIIHITFYKWMILFFSCACIVNVLIGHLLSERERGQYIYKINVHNKDKEIEEYVFMDSGNRLWDTVYGKPVLILSKETIGEIVSKEESSFIEKYYENGKLDYSDPVFLKSYKGIHFHEISYHSVGKVSGKILCILVDSVEVTESKKLYLKQPVAIADGRLFQGKGYNGLIFSDDF